MICKDIYEASLALHSQKNNKFAKEFILIAYFSFILTIMSIILMECIL